MKNNIITINSEPRDFVYRKNNFKKIIFLLKVFDLLSQMNYNDMALNIFYIQTVQVSANERKI